MSRRAGDSLLDALPANPTDAEGLFMSPLELYRELYEYEKDCNDKMLTMLESVPVPNRSDARFQRAVTLADHLAAGREKWLDYMAGTGQNQIPWWDERCDLATLRPRFAALETNWSGYLAHIEADRLEQDFKFTESNGESFRLPIEVQIVQLVGHAPYHRGQVALLVDQLGGETVDTDYADWWWMNRKEKH
jgi:uncharacterized damage-inducible protein DinB